MLPIFLAQVAASVLVVVSPKTWDTTTTLGAPPAEQHIDVKLRNGTRAPMLWHLMSLPPWADCWADPAHHELGRAFSGSIDPGSTAVVRIDFGTVPAAYVPGTYVWDAAFFADGSGAFEVGVDCSLTVLAPQ